MHSPVVEVDSAQFWYDVGAIVAKVGELPITRSLRAGETVSTSMVADDIRVLAVGVVERLLVVSPTHSFITGNKTNQACYTYQGQIQHFWRGHGPLKGHLGDVTVEAHIARASKVCVCGRGEGRSYWGKVHPLWDFLANQQTNFLVSFLDYCVSYFNLLEKYLSYFNLLEK